MSTEEIIHAWKHNEDDADKQPEGEQPPTGKKRPEDKQKPAGKVPSNPLGDQQITDEDLDAVEGGRAVAITCDANSC